MKNLILITLMAILSFNIAGLESQNGLEQICGPTAYDAYVGLRHSLAIESSRLNDMKYEAHHEEIKKAIATIKNDLKFYTEEKQKELLADNYKKMAACEKLKQSKKEKEFMMEEKMEERYCGNTGYDEYIFLIHSKEIEQARLKDLKYQRHHEDLRKMIARIDKKLENYTKEKLELLLVQNNTQFKACLEYRQKKASTIAAGARQEKELLFEKSSHVDFHNTSFHK